MKVIILRGIPGAGKSTFQKAKFPNAVVCSADQYFMDSNGEYKFDRTKLRLAHYTCMNKFLVAMEYEDPEIVIDNTNLRTEDYKDYVTLALATGYQVEIYTLSCDTLLAINRNVHMVPPEQVLRMYNRMQPVKSEWQQYEVKVYGEPDVG